MKIHPKSSNITPGLIGLSLLLMILAHIIALLGLTRIVLPTINKSPSLTDVQPTILSPQIYQLEIVNNRIELTPKTIDIEAASAKDAIELTLNKLLSKSLVFDPTSTIPQQTRLIDFYTDKKGIYINLSQEFTQGGGSSSMIYRVAQILYTATSLEPKASVFLSVEGKPLNKNSPLGGEGLLLNYPLTRQQFNQDFLVR